MGKIKPPAKVKLISGFIFKDETVYERLKSLLEKRFGALDFQSVPLPFTYTDYYEKEFGTHLTRRFVSFKKLIPPEQLASVKVSTNRLETSFCRCSIRQINIDPGYLSLSKLVLASTKDFFHRIYIGKGIHAELTLYYQHKAFKNLDWTYPDYRTQEYHAIFHQIRELYAAQLKK